MRKIICTTGTSIAAPVGLINPAGSSPSEWTLRIQQRISDTRKDCPDNKLFCEKISAEMHSLMRLPVKADDKIFLLHTDTAEGETCTLELKKLIETEFTVECVVCRINKLQVRDAKAFRTEGIQNLFREIDEICGGVNPEDVVLNVTGGFKAVVPYITLFGLLRNYCLVYIFEQSKELLRLPPVPITYDYECLAQAREAISKLKSAGVMSRRDFEKLIPAGFDYRDRQWFDVLVEEDDGFIAPSAFAQLLFGELDSHQSAVYLSPSARAAYDRSCGDIRGQFNFMLSRVGDPLWRQQKFHALSGSAAKLDCYKPGNTGERMFAYSVGKSKIVVCELVKHQNGEYEKFIKSPKSASDYPESSASIWTEPDESLQTVQLGLSYEDTIAGLDKQKELNELARMEIDELIAEKKKLEQKIAESSKNISSLQNSLNEKTVKLEQTQRENNYLKLPWWKKYFTKSKY